MMKKRLTLALIVLLLASGLPAYLAFSQEEAPYGPWVDEIRYESEENEANVVSKMTQGDMDIYLIDFSDPDLLEQVTESPVIDYKTTYGLYFELTFNPVGPEFPATGKFNPFSNQKIREAVNMLVDRGYIVNEIMQGLAVPKIIPVPSAFPDYGRLAETAVLIETKYKHDPDRAREIIFGELLDMGAENVGGKWYYNDEPIVLKFLIRPEDQRMQIGDYAADLFEELGFETERDYKKSAEASPIWLRGNPADGLYHVYTGGWITTSVSRDNSGNWAYFYTDMGLPFPLWQAYTNNPTLYDKAARLDRGEWTTWEERMQLMKDCAFLALEESQRVWLVDQLAPFLLSKNVQLAFDLAGGPNNPIWATTVRFKDQPGGVLKAGNREVFVDAWNTEAGSNWAYDMAMIRVVTDRPMFYNPYTGLPMPNMFVDASIEVEAGNPTSSTSDWLTVTEVDKVEVPTDAWYDWDAENKQVITAPAGTTAKCKVTVNWGDVIGTVKYHDGSTVSLADFFATWPLDFEQANPDSPFYDEATLSDFNQFKTIFKGMRLVSESPLVIEYYTDFMNREAEFIVIQALLRPGNDLWYWPTWPWQMTAIGMLAEQNGRLAFSPDKADLINTDWMNYIGGPSLSILEDALNEAISANYIPFGDFGEGYVTEAEAQERYQNLADWYDEFGHFWVSTGPFYLDQADFTGHSCVVKAFRDYRFKADRFAYLTEPPIPETSTTVPDFAIPGLEASFTVDLSLMGEPYPNDRIDFVKYLILDSAGNLVLFGEAEAGAEGEWNVDLGEADTSQLSAGSYEIQTIALSKDVAVPGKSETPFIVVPVVSYFQSVLAQTETRLNADIEDLQSTLTETQTTVAELQDTVESLGGAGVVGAIQSLQTTTYAAIAVAVIAIVIAVYAIISKR